MKDNKILLVLNCLILLMACSPEVMESGALSTLSRKASLKPDKVLRKIAFGSCNRQDGPQDMWRHIIQNRPDLWIWLGDNIYGDTQDMSVMEAKYFQAKSSAGYQRLLSVCPVIGIWDDHDYGVNDGGKRYPLKDESKKLMLDFLDVPAEAPVRKRPGAYQSYLFGRGSRRLKIILLDTRYFRDDLSRSPDWGVRYHLNYTGDILGEAQWEWLEQELNANEAEIHLIGSGIQFIPDEHGFEKWANFPNVRQRFFDLLQKTRPNRPILVSGDRHLAEISKIQLAGFNHPLYEITSSGLTHTGGFAMFSSESNSYRLGILIKERNFALLKIDWSGKEPEVTIEIRGLKNRLFQKNVLFRKNRGTATR